MHKDLNTVSLEISKLFVWFAAVPVTKLVCLYCVYQLVRVVQYSVLEYDEMFKCFPKNMIYSNVFI